MTAISHVWQAVLVCLCLQARRSYTESDVNKRAQPIYTLFVISLFSSVWNYCWVFLFVEPWGRRSLEKTTVQTVVSNPAWKAKLQQCELEMSAWNIPTDQRWNVLKIGKKCLKHRCLADVSSNTSSSSDMVSCLSSIHMLMFNQAAQSGSFSRHFFFFFPSNQFTLERDKSLRSHIRGELEQMVIWTEKRRRRGKKKKTTKTGKEAVGE